MSKNIENVIKSIKSLYKTIAYTVRSETNTYTYNIIYKNVAIANRSRVSCINTNNNTMTLKSGLEVTQCH